MKPFIAASDQVLRAEWPAGEAIPLWDGRTGRRMPRELGDWPEPT
jgi:hypothetical protein